MAKTGLVVHLTITAGKLDEFVDIARKHGERSVQIEEGCLSFDVMVPQDESSDEDNKVILVEVYSDDDALESHWASPHMQDYLKRVDDLIVERKRFRCSV